MSAQRLLPMAADERHAFSSGTLTSGDPAVAGRHERGASRVMPGRLSSESSRDAYLATGGHPESVYFESRTLPDQRHVVVYQPDGVWDSFHVTREHAQNHALALNEWLAARPRESDALPFFNPVVEDSERTSTERLFRILDAQLKPETRGLA